MSRLLSLLALAVLLAACDSASDDAATARLAVGETYAATTFRIADAGSGAVVIDFLQVGAAFDITFDDASHFTAHLAFPDVADTDDGSLDETVTGSYTQTDDAVTFFVADPDSDTLLDGDGWTVQHDGRALRYSDVEDGARIDLVLTRR